MSDSRLITSANELNKTLNKTLLKDYFWQPKFSKDLSWISINSSYLNLFALLIILAIGAAAGGIVAGLMSRDHPRASAVLTIGILLFMGVFMVTFHMYDVGPVYE